MINLIDTHAHILSKYYDNLEEILLKTKDMYIINCGVGDSDNLEIINLCKKHTNIFGTLGIHPSEVQNISDDSFKIIEDNINSERIIAVGEIGLDYYYDGDYELQKTVFKKQLDIARKYNLPVVIHSRDALEDTFSILSEYKDLKKILHCYSYDYEAALKFIEIGCVFGINGVVTFKNNTTLHEVVKNIDLKYFLLETDSPYLTPIPNRGKKNDSSNLIYIAQKVAFIKEIKVEEVVTQTFINTVREFDLKLLK